MTNYCLHADDAGQISLDYEVIKPGPSVCPCSSSYLVYFYFMAY